MDSARRSLINVDTRAAAARPAPIQLPPQALQAVAHKLGRYWVRSGGAARPAPGHPQPTTPRA